MDSVLVCLAALLLLGTTSCAFKSGDTSSYEEDSFERESHVTRRSDDFKSEEEPVSSHVRRNTAGAPPNLNVTKIKVIETPEDRTLEENNKSPGYYLTFAFAKSNKPTNKRTIDNKESMETPCAHTYVDRDSEDSEELSTSPFQKYPFAVSVQKKNSHYTNGVLVGRAWVLTTADDFYTVRESIKLFKARLGSVECKHGGLLVPIHSVQLHPQFHPSRPDYDVALLHLPYPVEPTRFVRPIPISHVTGHITSAKFLTTYWPRLIVNGRILGDRAKERLKSHNLRVSTQKLIPEDVCRSNLAQLNFTLGVNSLCLKPILAHHSVCTPDAGAPIIAKEELWGLTSGWTGPDCVRQPHLTPTLVTRLTAPAVFDWLNVYIHSK